MAPRPPGRQQAHAQADELAIALTAKGFTVSVHTRGGHSDRPCVEVSCGRRQLAEANEYVYVVPDGDGGQWWFWWYRGWSPERIAPATEVSVAADIVARSIAVIPRVGVRVV